MPSIADDNFLLMNQGRHPVVNFNYMLRVEAFFDLPCKQVRAFSRELEYEIIQEGGLNDYVHMRRKPIQKPFTLEVERYVGLDFFDPLPLGADLALPVVLIVSRYAGDFNPFTAARSYIFTGCTVIKKEYGELNGEQAGLLVDTTTLSYREMVCVDLPWSLNNDVDAVGEAPAKADTPPLETLEQIQYKSRLAFAKVLEAKDISEQEKEEILALIEQLPTVLIEVGERISAQQEILATLTEEGHRLAEEEAERRKAEEEADTKRGTASVGWNTALTAIQKAHEEQAAADQAAFTAKTELEVLAAKLKQAKQASTLMEADEAAAAELLQAATEELAAIEKNVTDQKEQLDHAKTAQQTAEDAQTALTQELSDAQADRQLAITALEDDPESEEAAAERDAAEQLVNEKTASLATAAAALAAANASLAEAEAAVRTAETARSDWEQQKKAAEQKMSEAKTALANQQSVVDGITADQEAAGEKVSTTTDVQKQAIEKVEQAEADGKSPKQEWETALAAYQQAHDAWIDARAQLRENQNVLRDTDAAIAMLQRSKSAIEKAQAAVSKKTADVDAEMEKIPPAYAICEESDGKVQAATELAAAKPEWEKVRSSSNGIQKSLLNLKSIHSYFANCMPATD